MKIDRRRDSIREWLEWQLPAPITAGSADIKPTKPSKPRFVGFEGSVPDQNRNLDETGKELEDACHRTQLDCARKPERVMSWAEWKAATLNQLFLEQGSSGEPGRITAETVLHGKRMGQMIQQRRDERARA